MAVGIVEGVEDTVNSQWGKMYYSLIHGEALKFEQFNLIYYFELYRCHKDV